jgi:hypothetical protein
MIGRAPILFFGGWVALKAWASAVCTADVVASFIEKFRLVRRRNNQSLCLPILFTAVQQYRIKEFWLAELQDGVG